MSDSSAEYWLEQGFPRVARELARGADAQKRRASSPATRGQRCRLQTHGVKPAVNVNVLPRHRAGKIAQEVYRGLADFITIDVAVQRRFSLDVREHLIDSPHRHGAERLEGTGRYGVDPN